MVEPPPPVPEPEELPEEEEVQETEAVSQPPPPNPEAEELRFAKIQAEAILEDARKEASQYIERSREEFEAERQILVEQAKNEGYSAGYADGLEQALQEGRRQNEEMAREQIRSVEQFLSKAAQERNALMDRTREEMKDLAVAIAEKVIRVSLKNSSDILLRMVDAATDTHKRCEWAHIYVADCDLNGKVYTAPELTAALGHISSRIRVIPMADDESGTCIVELPDVILDASVSTQMEKIKEVLDGVMPDRD